MASVVVRALLLHGLDVTKSRNERWVNCACGVGGGDGRLDEAERCSEGGLAVGGFFEWALGLLMTVG